MNMVTVAAVDRTDKAVEVVKEAENVAKAFNEPVHVVHVLTVSEFVNLGRTAANSAKSVTKDKVKGIAREIAQDHAEKLSVESEAVGLMGDPAGRILDYANENQSRYIVIGPRNRSPAGKAIFGSVAQSILLQSDVPVISTVS